MIEGGLDDFGVDPSERETMPPEPEPTNRDIMRAIEGIALRLDRIEINFQIMRNTIESHGTKLAELENRVDRLERISSKVPL